jgi:hypothetical protein
MTLRASLWGSPGLSSREAATVPGALGAACPDWHNLYMSSLAEIMSQAAQEMALSLAKIRTAMNHNLSKGEAAEESVRSFFRRYLPPSLGVTKGQVVDSTGQRTRQLDVIIYDVAHTPMLFSSDEDGHRLVPSEGVIAVIEVKTQVGPGM